MIALSGAFFSKKLSNFSEMSKTTTIVMISPIEAKKEPKNFRMIYQSILRICKGGLNAEAMFTPLLAKNKR